ncbi:MAG: MBL fold metallo-hydrolase [Planctomycetes bacterium]|nr:MBL fold metallo-hydrolase [Planctomycetota bacterium]
MLPGIDNEKAELLTEINVEWKYEFMNSEPKTVSTPGVKKLTITVVHDTDPHQKGREADWGFAIFITGTEKTILFDTGGRFLLNSMRKLAIEPDSVDVLFLSHVHKYHPYELGGFLKENSNVTMYLPVSFSKEFRDNTRDDGAKVIGVKKSRQICKNVYSTGQLGKVIKEHSLIIRTDKGLVIVTGCAHPGIINVVNTAKELMQDDIFLVIGGFHDENRPLPLEWATQDRKEEIISAFKQLGVRYVGPCHCSGEQVRSLFKRHYGRKYIDISTGKVITLTDIK